MSNNKLSKLIKLIQENPDLPILFAVNSEVVPEDDGNIYLGECSECDINEIYKGRRYWHFKDDDEEDVLTDLAGCKYSHDFDGNDIYELSDEEWKNLFESLPWEKAIFIYIYPEA